MSLLATKLPQIRSWNGAPARLATALVLATMLVSCGTEFLPDPQQADTSEQLFPVPGRPDLAVRTSLGITGFLTAVQDPEGTVTTFDPITGSGRIEARSIVIEGILSPGNTPGCIDFSGDVTFNTSSTFLAEIGGTNVCTEYDHVNVANTLTINGATLQVVLVNSYVPVAGQRFDILDWGTIVGSFGVIDTSAAPLTGGLFWDTTLLHTTGELVIGSSADTDGDGVGDHIDNCTLVINPAQRDTDFDGFGNVCDPDFDNSLLVDTADLSFFNTRFFSADPDADLNGDGFVNATDLAILKSFFFKPPGPSALAPELAPD